MGHPIAPENKAGLEDIRAYLVRAPLSLEKLVYLDGKQAVLYRSKMNPGLGRNFEALDPLEWRTRMTDHIPDPGKHRTLFYVAYANRTRGAKEPKPQDKQALPKRKRCTPSWQRLIHKVYITDSLSIKQVLDSLGLSTVQTEKPPPAPREVRVVALDEEGQQIGEVF